ncbi:family 2 encapsulin nanocompartment cargo protein polyprenyl transferase [Streptomyces sp. Da 82-17]|uniref:family 2 encapsulin nanocompartment cargo protein polyprenyl transferase n=1 Tax=Streptomyces sp. Da 82-17 TaxID=3377116 RepID=UPI0038D46A56
MSAAEDGAGSPAPTEGRSGGSGSAGAGSAGSDRAFRGGGRGVGAGESREAAALLDRTREAVEPELRRAVGSLDGTMRRVVTYHFGWEHADGRPAAGRGGKAIRPGLVLAAARALGGSPTAAVKAAAAVELVHNSTLLHDDVIDRDSTRRHRPTAWTVFGDADAILAGDALQALAFRVLADDPHPASGDAAARLAACLMELCEGQHVDTALEDRSCDEVTLDESMSVAEAKTGALLGTACALGALYAGAEWEQVEAMDAFGRQAGLAFQLIDDIIGIWGDPARTGKPVGADLLAGKKSLPVVAALASGTKAGAELAELYPKLLPADVERAAEAIDRAGGRDWAQTEAADRMSRALGLLARAVPDPDAAGGLLALAEFVTRRTA